MAIGLVSDEDFEESINNSLPPDQRVTRSKLIKRTHSPISTNTSREIIETPNPVEAEVVELVNPGRKEGDNNVPPSLRKLIAKTSIEEGRPAALNLAKQFGLSSSSVSAYSKGSTSTDTYNKPNDELQEFILDIKGKISKKASIKLAKALNNITDEKLENAKVHDIAAVAKMMSGIVKDMTPEVVTDFAKTGPTFVIYSPQVKDENKYEVIQSGE